MTTLSEFFTPNLKQGVQNQQNQNEPAQFQVVDRGRTLTSALLTKVRPSAVKSCNAPLASTPWHKP
jgi:hypothetical protein